MRNLSKIIRGEKLRKNLVKTFTPLKIEEKTKVLEEDTDKIFPKEEIDKILEEAKKKAEEIINQAEREKVKIQKDAYEVGFKKGYEEGRKKGEIEEKEKLKQKFSSLEFLLEEMKKQVKQNLEDLKKIYFDFAFKFSLEFSKTLIMTEVKTNKDVIVNILNKVFEETTKFKKIKIKINPEDLAYLKELKILIPDKVIFEEDKNILKGGCLVETEMGLIDARIDEMLKKAEEKILKFVKGEI